MAGADFSNYELGLGLDVFSLADDLLWEIAEAADYDLGVAATNEERIRSFIGKVGPDKELQKNISVVREALGDNAAGRIADWIDRSGIMFPVERSFMDNIEPPARTDVIVWTGGVANWMLRRATHNLRFDPRNTSRVVLPIGNREMKPGEHQLVETYRRRHEGKLPTESDFAQAYLVGMLAMAGFRAEVIAVDDNRGDKVMDALFAEHPGLLDFDIVAISNAPNAIQVAGELRLAARRVDPRFDNTGEQLYMSSDSFPVARRGESAKTHQNPETALGQLVRNALYLELNQPD